MGYNSIYVQGLQEALVEKEKATAAIKGLLGRIAAVKADQLEELLKEKKPLASKGFVLANVSYEITDWRSEAFRLDACFILKDVAVPKGATSKEIKLMNEYKELMKEGKWDYGWWREERMNDAREINRELHGLKNNIEVMKSFSWKTSYSDILKGDSFFKKGFSFREG